MAVPMWASGGKTSNRNISHPSAAYTRVNSESKYGCQSIVIMFLVPTNIICVHVQAHLHNVAHIYLCPFSSHQT